VSSLLLQAVLEATDRLPLAVVEELVVVVLRASSTGAVHVLAEAVPHHDFRRAADALAAAWQLEPDVSGRELAAMLRAAAAARAAADREGRVEVVMTGPSEADAPTRSTEAVVIELVAGARRELILVTYAAAPYPPLLAELELARARGVRTQVVVETVAGARGLLTSEPFHAFASTSGVELFHWPLDRRPGPTPGRLHAKLAVADGEVAFVTSANLTGSAIERNLECGLLVHGGPAPRRLAGHIAALMRDGVLQPLTPSIEEISGAP
jgi:phosphatidylserine/phosphatidylglycerophosphate/cardiolipin synthase-like enzyme